MKDKQKQLEKRRQYRDKNKERINFLKREYYSRSKEVQKRYYKTYLYGITQEEYNRLLEKQEGKCAICKQKETVIQKQTKEIRDLSIDHCHNSNKIRGLLCHKCNIALGMFKDSINNLEAAIEYLKLMGDEDMQEELRHGKQSVIIKPEVARFEDIGEWK